MPIGRDHTHDEDPHEGSKQWIYRSSRWVLRTRASASVEFLTERKLRHLEIEPVDSTSSQEDRNGARTLKLEQTDDVHSLGDPAASRSFPVKRCLSIIGSDYRSYGATKELTGNFSDGLVRQDHGYVVSGPKPADGSDYPDDRRSFWANVHRAHSGYRGIVNSYESYENIQRFLFGDTKAEICLVGIEVGIYRADRVTTTISTISNSPSRSARAVPISIDDSRIHARTRFAWSVARSPRACSCTPHSSTHACETRGISFRILAGRSESSSVGFATGFSGTTSTQKGQK